MTSSRPGCGPSLSSAILVRLFHEFNPNVPHARVIRPDMTYHDHGLIVVVMPQGQLRAGAIVCQRSRDGSVTFRCPLDAAMSSASGARV